MLKSNYIEDIFIEFYYFVTSDRINVQWHDSAPISSFGSSLLLGNDLTKAQSDYVLRILNKYKSTAKAAGFDYEMLLVTPVWKKSFRVLDYTKRVHVELHQETVPVVCLKFPYDFKKTFDQEFSELLSSNSFKSWDSDRKLRTIPLYDINLVKLHDFLNKHNFDLDDSFVDVVALIEETWNQQDSIIPTAEVVDGNVVLKNTTEDTDIWWNENKTNDLNTDMFVAKSMGYLVNLHRAPQNDLETIVSKPENMFWAETNNRFFEIYKQLKTGSVCVILDRTSDTQEWVRNFVISSTHAGIDRSDIKVCFRESDLNKKGRFNEWIREQGLGGTVDTGRIFIFDSKPAKWLFAKEVDVKLILTNNLYPNTNNMTQQWLEHHPCVIYVGDIKPSQKRNNKIVQL
jgi:hypothetical protein